MRSPSLSHGAGRRAGARSSDRRSGGRPDGGRALALPNANTDIFSYIASARVAAVHDANPYEYPPTAFPNDPVYPYVSEQYRENLPSKLPAFMLLNISLAELPGDDPVANLLTYRLAFFALSVATLVLSCSLPGAFFRVGGRRARPVRLESRPHRLRAIKTDVVMVFLLAPRRLSATRVARERAGLVALGLSALVKLISLPLVVLTMSATRTCAAGAPSPSEQCSSPRS